ncbi:DUF6507 family protein [Nocardiopsis halophila]|uniref:DUF6507 family protein n=1 Tax=Nocardiopsis halophila TaxID=141692 RepID=UPI0003774E5B|nr:DUF6507 family protein [Nocardiopsis halophila]
MSGWDIDAESVFATLSYVGSKVGGEDGTGGLVGDSTTVGEKITYAEQCASSYPITKALGEFGENCGPILQAMVARGASCVTGCSDAVAAYLDGDTEMAARAQEQAGHADLDGFCI